jgi:hypothetical protein
MGVLLPVELRCLCVKALLIGVIFHAPYHAASQFDFVSPPRILIVELLINGVVLRLL